MCESESGKNARRKFWTASDSFGGKNVGKVCEMARTDDWDGRKDRPQRKRGKSSWDIVPAIGFKLVFCLFIFSAAACLLRRGNRDLSLAIDKLLGGKKLRKLWLINQTETTWEKLSKKMENWWENLCKNWCGKSTLGKKLWCRKLLCLETGCKQTSETPAVFRLFTNYNLNYYLQGG